MQIIIAALAIMMSPFASAASLGFDGDATGSEPQGWRCGVTGKGAAVWRVETDPSAPSPPNILKQSGQGTFPWCVVRDASLIDGFVEVKFKPLSGREDQAGGVIWRWKDSNNYYVARANALENNVSLYYVERGRRITLKYVDAPVPPNVWHTLRVAFVDTRIKVTLDGTTRIEHTDNHIIGTGTVGVWTKADSITSFDDFAYGPPGANR
jgi:hypothetical protein